MFSRQRAEAIARTETTGAMNTGHQAGYELLDDDGLIGGKSWDSVADGDVRESHTLAHTQTVKVREHVRLALPAPSSGRRRKAIGDGFETCPFPGWWWLTPANRVNCRCTTLAAFEAANLEAVDLDPALLEG